MVETVFQEPRGDKLAGYHHMRRPLTPYEKFMKEEDIPIVYGIGVYDVRQQSLGPWKRMGGRGAFFHLDGLRAIKGMYVVEVPATGALNPEHHFYDEFMYVVEGRGSTEVWRENSPKKRTFEWQPGSLFTIPINTQHRLVNASSSPALVLVATNAPPIMDIFQSRSCIFDNPYQFWDRYDESEDYFRAHDKLETDTVCGRAMIRSNIIPDIVHCELPLDNQRAPGYRRILPMFHGFHEDLHTGGFIAEYPTGRYSKAHYHDASAVLVCLRGKGYSFTWPRELGPRPWEAGKGHLVKRQDYVAGGLVAAAPGGGDWFHQHFGIGKEPLRVLNFWGGPSISRDTENDTDREIPSLNTNIEEGGKTINYRNEDPYVLAEYKSALEREGAKLQMPESLYR